MALDEVTYPRVAFYVQGGSGISPTVEEVGLFVYDTSKLYAILRLALDEWYAEHEFGRYDLYRLQSTLDPEDTLALALLEYRSPTKLAGSVRTAGVAIGSLWALVQTLAFVADYPLQRRKLELEVRQLEREERLAVPPYVLDEPSELERYMYHRGAGSPFKTVRSRLRRSAIKAEELDLTIIESSDDWQLEEWREEW